MSKDWRDRVAHADSHIRRILDAWEKTEAELAAPLTNQAPRQKLAGLQTIRSEIFELHESGDDEGRERLVDIFTSSVAVTAPDFAIGYISGKKSGATGRVTATISFPLYDI